MQLINNADITFLSKNNLNVNIKCDLIWIKN